MAVPLEAGHHLRDIVHSKSGWDLEWGVGQLQYNGPKNLQSNDAPAYLHHIHPEGRRMVGWAVLVRILSPGACWDHALVVHRQLGDGNLSHATCRAAILVGRSAVRADLQHVQQDLVSAAANGALPGQ